MLVGLFWLEGQAGAQLISLTTRDNVRLQVQYSPPKNANPTVFMFHGLASAKEEWTPLENKLQQHGWGTVSYDARDYRMGGGRQFKLMVDDVGAVFEEIRRRQQKNTSARLSYFFVGASLGANVALSFAADKVINGQKFSDYMARVLPIKGIVLLSAGLNYQGIETELPMINIGSTSTPVLIVASRSDPYAYDSAVILQSKNRTSEFWSDVKQGHGVQMFDAVLLNRLFEWLNRHR